MSANLLDGGEAIAQGGTTYADGVWSIPANGKEKNAAKVTLSGTEAVSGNQTLHVGLSVRAASGASVVVLPGVAYVDGAGNVRYVKTRVSARGTGAWQRVEGSFVMPSGRVSFLFVNQGAGGAALELTAPCLSYGSPVTLASSAHTPYATQDHVSVTYATKASLKVTDDSIKAEVSARAQTDQNVADLSSRLTQTANSLTSEISDRKSAIATVTGLANAAQSTADGAAKQANFYTIGLGDAGAVAKWIHLGTLTSAGDASSATIAIVFGNGYNGHAGQNSKLTITIKDGAQSTPSATGACGVTAMRENCDNALVDVLAQSATVYDVWVYAPWAYSNGRYSISGQYAAWQHSGATQKDEPATSATQVKQDVAYRLADATKAQTMATENKSSIKQLSNSITTEVTERGKLAGRVGTLEANSGTHTSKLEQLASSIKSLVKGESTYTDPDGASATSGIYSLVTQTRDSVTALFGDYTKTEDLASTQAVKDAKKAGTDAQAAASAAQTTADSAKSTAQTAASDAATAKTNAASAVSTANSASTSAANAVETANAASSTASSASSTANSAASTASAAKSTADAAKTSAASAVSTANSASSTAGAAKSTADSLATMVRQYSGGVLVGKVGAGVGALVNADGSFDVVDVTWDGETPTVGDAITTFESNAARFLGGLAVISSEPYSAGRSLVLSHVGDEAQDMPLLALTAALAAGTSGKYPNTIRLHPGGNGAGVVHADGPVYAHFGVYAPYDEGFMCSTPNVLFMGSYDYTKNHPVTLSQPASNFYLMCIIARGAYGVYDSVTVPDPDGKKVAFDIANVNGTYREHHSKVYQIQGQTINTFNDNGWWEGKLVVNGGAVSQVRESCVGIECVIGWRKGGQR